MSAQLQELIDRIKKEGVREAEETAAQIREKAESEAGQIVADAKREAETALEKAKREASQFEAASKEAVKQAGRDLILKIRAEVTALFDAVLHREISESLDAQVVKEAVLTLLKEWSKRETADVQILLPEKDLKKVKDYLLDKLSEKVKKGVEIKASSQLQAGFRVSERGGSAYYDFSDRGITDFLMEFLNPKVAEILKGSQD